MITIGINPVLTIGPISIQWYGIMWFPRTRHPWGKIPCLQLDKVRIHSIGICQYRVFLPANPCLSARIPYQSQRALFLTVHTSGYVPKLAEAQPAN